MGVTVGMDWRAIIRVYSFSSGYNTLTKLSFSIRDYYGLVSMATEQNSTVLARSMVKERGG